jgi:hypothetical protein
MAPISKIVKELQKIKSKNGDLNVCGWNFQDFDLVCVEKSEVRNDKVVILDRILDNDDLEE